LQTLFEKKKVVKKRKDIMQEKFGYDVFRLKFPPLKKK